MKIMVIGRTAVVIASGRDEKLPAALRGKMFRRGMVIGASRHLPALLAHFEEKVVFVGEVRTQGNMSCNH